MIRFKKLHPDAIIPTRANPGDAGLDLYAVEDVEIPASMLYTTISRTEVFDGVKIGQKRIPTGIAVEIPYGYYGKVSSRSGLAFKSGIFGFDGTVDAGYRSEIGVLLYNTTDRPYHVKKGDRVAQLLIIPCSILEPVEVDELSDSERSTAGFGSSGR